MCCPSARFEAGTYGELHAVNPASSSEHSNESPASLAVNVNIGRWSDVDASGWMAMIVSGTLVSTCAAMDSFTVSALPALSVVK